MWYVMQTQTGKEQELVNAIRLMVDPAIYTRCFFVKRESVLRLKGECIVRKEVMFPGYVFVITEQPTLFYQQLKHVPYYTKLLGKEEGISWGVGNSSCSAFSSMGEVMPMADEIVLPTDDLMQFSPISQEEKQFLESLINGDAEDTVRLSPVIVNKNGDIQKVGGMLKQYQDIIIKKRIRLRYVIIRLTLFGRQRDIYMGIRLAGDAGESEREFLKTFFSGEAVEKYKDAAQTVSGQLLTEQAPASGSAVSGLKDFAWELSEGIAEGVQVVITDGPFEGIMGIVKEIEAHRHTVGIEVEMFGRTTMIWVDYSVGMDVI